MENIKMNERYRMIKLTKTLSVVLLLSATSLTAGDHGIGAIPHEQRLMRIVLTVAATAQLASTMPTLTAEATINLKKSRQVRLVDANPAYNKKRGNTLRGDRNKFPARNTFANRKNR